MWQLLPWFPKLQVLVLCLGHQAFDMFDIVSDTDASDVFEIIRTIWFGSKTISSFNDISEKCKKTTGGGNNMLNQNCFVYGTNEIEITISTLKQCASKLFCRC